MRSLLVLVLLVGCGGPILQNVPRPDPAVVAGAAAAVAGVATLADPDAAHEAEAKTPRSQPRPRAPGPTVPTDVLDRLDAEAAARRDQR